MRTTIPTPVHDFIRTIPENELRKNIEIRKTVQEMNYLLKELLEKLSPFIKRWFRVINKEPNDIPASLALVLLFIVIGLLWIVHHGSLKDFNTQEVNAFLERNSLIIIAGGLSFLFNLAWIGTILKSTYGLQKQGTRLSRLMEKPQVHRVPSRDELVLGMVSGTATYLFIHFWNRGGLIGPGFYFSQEALNKASIFFQFNLSLLVAFFLFVLRRLPHPWLPKRKPNALPDFPQVPNSIVLGSSNEINEDEYQFSDAEKPDWVVLNRKALNGNILITGSIGGGKSQGTILPYFEQILQNFSPSPSILAIDPKGTFLKEAVEIVHKTGLSDQLICLEIDGDVTFNPIFEPHALRSGRFVRIARMVRAAAANFMGKPLDDPFWEESANNLVKNSLVYCAATLDYFTLNDLYRAIIKANENTIAEELDQVLGNRAFTSEERFNIEQARQYFAGEFAALESRVRTSILATSTSFLNQFRESQASQIFCPPIEKLTLPSIDKVIDQGKIILFGITDPGLARSMGTFIKLHFEQSLLNRLNDDRPRKRMAVLIVDEYQDVVSTASGGLIGDNSFLAKGREANTLSIMATQSLTSLFNAVGKETSAQELIQNFRTRIAGHSFDLKTIHSFQELVGKKDFERTSRSLAEQTHNPKLNLIHGGFESNQANLSESINVSEIRDFAISGKDFSTLPTFECFAHVYDGVRTEFKKLFLKPHFLKDKTLPHSEILKDLAKGALAATLAFSLHLSSSFAFPNVCSTLNSSYSDTCIDFSVSTCMCGWPTPHPCAHFSYYLPQTYVETFPDPKASFFKDLPGASIQLGASTTPPIPYGTESDLDTHSFQSHTVSVPFQMLVEQVLPCGGTTVEKMCFDGMSEDLGSLWNTGSADSLQPNFILGGLSPAACLTAGAISSVTGNLVETPHPGSPICSFDHSWMLKFPPSNHEPCNGWGVFFPRSGVANGISQSASALMVASRMKSLSTDVFQTTPRSPLEKWEMIAPQVTSCFREGENVGLLETVKSVREEKRLVSGKWKGHLFVVWNKYSCCRELSEVPVAYATLGIIKAACAGVGEL